MAESTLQEDSSNNSPFNNLITLNPGGESCPDFFVLCILYFCRMKNIIKHIPLNIILLLLLIHATVLIYFNFNKPIGNEAEYVVLSFYYFNFFWLLILSVTGMIAAVFVRSSIILRFTLLTGLLYLIFVLTTIEMLNIY